MDDARAVPADLLASLAAIGRAMREAFDPQRRIGEGAWDASRADQSGPDG